MSNEPDEVNNGALTVIIGLLAVGTLAVGLVVTALVRDETAEMHASVDQSQEHGFRQTKAKQLTSLSGALAWADRDKDEVRIPIRRAMKMVTQSVRRSPISLTPLPPKKEEEKLVEPDADSEEKGENPGAAASPVEKASAAPEKSSAPKTPAAPKTVVAPKKSEAKEAPATKKLAPKAASVTSEVKTQP